MPGPPSPVRLVLLLLLGVMLPRACCCAAAFLRPLRARRLRARQLRLYSSSSSSSGSSSSADEASSPHLSLVFDINKTILLDDPAGGKDTRALLNEIVSELAWGHHHRGGSGTEEGWTSAGLPLSVDPPTPPSLRDLVTYSSYVHATYPDVAGADIRRAKRTRDALKGSFTEGPDGPGREYAQEVAALDAALRIDPTGLSPALLEAAGLAGRDRVAVLPAFFHLLRRLREGEYPGTFSLQLRTFGDDLPRVIAEFNAFCRGQHPLFPGVRLDCEEVQHSLDTALVDAVGCMYCDAAGPALVLGTFDAPASRDELASCLRRGHRVLEGVWEIHAFVRARQLSPRPTLAIRDYYPWWRGNLEEGWAGKLVTVDEDEGVFAIALDDNIERTRSHIVDLRDAASGEPVPFDEGVAGGHLVRAEPYLAIRDPQNYFWSVLQECLRRRLRRRWDARGERPPPPPPPSGA